MEELGLVCCSKMFMWFWYVVLGLVQNGSCLKNLRSRLMMSFDLTTSPFCTSELQLKVFVFWFWFDFKFWFYSCVYLFIIFICVMFSQTTEEISGTLTKTYFDFRSIQDFRSYQQYCWRFQEYSGISIQTLLLKQL